MEQETQVAIAKKLVAALRTEDELQKLLGEGSELAPLVRRVFSTLLERDFPEFNTPEHSKVLTRIYKEAGSWGPLSAYLADQSVTEIMVNGPGELHIERGGRIEEVSESFLCAETLSFLIERIFTPLGKHLDAVTPYADGRLPDGSRVNAVVGPVAIKGPVLTIRKFSSLPTSERFFLSSGTLTEDSIEFLSACIRGRVNLVVSGGTGCGKTTLLNFLAGFIPGHERIITIEDTAELRLAQRHVVPLEARPSSPQLPEISIRDLVVNSLRMRPDRIVVGECRSKEALDMLQAMNTGHEGSLTTIHANSVRDALNRLETLVLLAGVDLPALSIRRQIASAIHVVIQMQRLEDGSRRVVQISELTGMEREVLLTGDIFALEKTEGPRPPRLVPTGVVPNLAEKMRRRGQGLDLSLFQPRSS